MRGVPPPTARPPRLRAGRTWRGVGGFVQEVAVARIYDGVRARTPREVGTALGKKIGALAGRRLPRPPAGRWRRAQRLAPPGDAERGRVWEPVSTAARA